MNKFMWKNNLLFFPVIFAGILGIFGIFEDIFILTGQGNCEASTIFLKYYAATLGTVGFAFVQYMAKKHGDDINT